VVRAMAGRSVAGSVRGWSDVGVTGAVSVTDGADGAGVSGTSGATGASWVTGVSGVSVAAVVSGAAVVSVAAVVSSAVVVCGAAGVCGAGARVRVSTGVGTDPPCSGRPAGVTVRCGEQTGAAGRGRPPTRENAEGDRWPSCDSPAPS
jgi:collagen type VII alpha